MGVHFERAGILYDQKRYEQAEREMREELAENPHSGVMHAFMGRCLAQQKKLQEALAEGQEAVRLAPHVAYVHHQLSLTHNNCGRLKEAEESVREALRLDPRNVDQVAWLSWIQALRGDQRAALATADRGLEIDPQHVTCLRHRGSSLRRLGIWKESEIALRAALVIDPENSITHASLAYTLWGRVQARAGVGPAFMPWAVSWRRERREALAHFRESLRLDPGSEWARTGAAEILLMRSQAVILSTVVVFMVALVPFLAVVNHSPAHSNAAVRSDDETTAMESILVIASAFLTACSSGPICMVMRRSRLGEAVLTTGQRQAAKGTVVCLLAAVLAGLSCLFVPLPIGLAGLFLSVALIQPLTLACESSPGRAWKLMAGYCVLLAIGGMVCWGLVGFGQGKTQDIGVLLLLLGGAIGSFGALKVAPYINKSFAK